MAGPAMSFNSAQSSHVEIMRRVLAAVQDTPLVLKGGTALLLCYGLDRFSEDLDFDAAKKLNLESRIENALAPVTTKLRITRTKDTDTVQRYRIEYSDPSGIEGRLKLEVSCRGIEDESQIIVRSGFRTYSITRLITQKLGALEGRTTARDLYDVAFLIRGFRSEFSPENVARLQLLFRDVNEIEGRFRPAFEEDDLFRHQAELLTDLILSIQESLG